MRSGCGSLIKFNLELARSPFFGPSVRKFYNWLNVILKLFQLQDGSCSSLVVIFACVFENKLLLANSNDIFDTHLLWLHKHIEFALLGQIPLLFEVN